MALVYFSDSSLLTSSFWQHQAPVVFQIQHALQCFKMWSLLHALVLEHLPGLSSSSSEGTPRLANAFMIQLPGSLHGSVSFSRKPSRNPPARVCA